ncbi:ribonuclease HII [Candidatus Chloroploca sp. Khr17]|uniref:ribonuclease HII n=1 Tax=Candidatus Chloroploca sp. Khr17 TaxID=2496869 RepID=UPI00101BE6B7|nr:ribonuclease HII [Candidatus Chloroploca sp. Khr17]
MAPTCEYERELVAQGYQVIAGLDEAGRGCWAGPVVAAAVVFPRDLLMRSETLYGIDDSKQLSALAREQGYAQVRRWATGIGVGIVPAYLIDAFGIIAATRLAMMVALLQLPCQPHALLLDALVLPTLRLPQQPLIKGDARSLSIAAASLVAKVTRDRLMQTADQAFPVYGFAAHKGYGTAQHKRMLDQHGACGLHRRTFAPLLALQAEGA